MMPTFEPRIFFPQLASVCAALGVLWLIWIATP